MEATKAKTQKRILYLDHTTSTRCFPTRIHPHNSQVYMCNPCPYTHVFQSNETIEHPPTFSSVAQTLASALH